MPRTTKGAARNKAKRRLYKRAKGYRGGRGNLLRTVKETLVRAEVYAYRDRRVRKRNFRRLWIIRINAAARVHGMSYSRLVHGLILADVQIDRKQLADLSVREPDAFAEVARVASEALAA